MSRVVRLIHGRQSMRATPSCSTISLLQMSRNYKFFTFSMVYEDFFNENIDLDRLFDKDFRQFPYLLWSECWILSNC